MKTILLCLLHLGAMSQALWAQTPTLQGRITSAADNTPLAGAEIFWLDTTTGTLSDEEGFFSLPVSLPLPAQLVVRYVAFRTDTVAVQTITQALDIRMEPISTATLDIHSRVMATEISRIETQKVEKLNTDELYKAACCNLNESFENNGSTDAQWSDAVTGTRDIRMLGLDGPWTVLTTDAQRYPRGIQRGGALGYIPGAWIDNLSVSKGPGSVAQGHESAAGTINLGYKRPATAEPLFINLYGNQMGRLEANAVSAAHPGKRLHVVNFGHYSQLQQDNDLNSDGFLDLPRYRQYNLASRWDADLTKGWSAHFGGQHYQEWKDAGQTTLPGSFLPSEGTTAEDWRYRVDMKTQLYQGYAKLGYVFPQQKWKSLAVQLDGSHWNRTTTLGTRVTGLRPLNLQQQQANANFLYSSIISDSRHQFLLGASMLMDNNFQQIDSLSIDRQEVIPAAFAEYTWKPLEQITVVAGMRTDIHNLYGMQHSPRLHLRYTLKENWVFRLNGGRAWHSPSPIAENMGMFVSNRRVILDKSNLQVEANWNMGGSITRHIELPGNRKGYLTLDAYHTRFTSQMVADRDADAAEIRLVQLNDGSYANSLQVEANAEILKGLDLRLSWKGYDVQQTTAGRLQPVALMPTHRVLANVGWKVGHLSLDFTAQWYGTQRLPTLEGNGITRTPDYTFLLTQATWQAKQWAVYAGGENLLNFRQQTLIQGANDWTGSRFDASLVWGPPIGRMFYVGMRWSLPTKENRKGAGALPNGHHEHDGHDHEHEHNPD
ncbi:MAG: carboxypeptidase-like regulatory domain-containing protein [Bacteroidetes bacterium]|nr:carboxypeptidase-like regulatory domain-containing protein [Bacteroidota bacterium]